MAHEFFVRGTMHRLPYGGAPTVIFNHHQESSVAFPRTLKSDVSVFEEVLGIGFFHYGPPLWMVGEVEPLKALCSGEADEEIHKRIIHQYPTLTLEPDATLYRLRKSPCRPDQPLEYDSPPDDLVGHGRLDTWNSPVLYASGDLEICIHECRVTAEDTTYVATLSAVSRLRLLDLSVLLDEDGVTSFESLDMAIHMLFLADSHSYPTTRKLSEAIRRNGFDGLLFPS